MSEAPGGGSRRVRRGLGSRGDEGERGEGGKGKGKGRSDGLRLRGENCQRCLLGPWGSRGFRYRCDGPWARHRPPR
eukprot:4010604-Pyramimonas_sp.AAC.1